DALPICRLQLDFQLLHVGALVLVGVVAVDFEFDYAFLAHFVSCLERARLGREAFHSHGLHGDRLVFQAAALGEPQGVAQPVLVVAFRVIAELVCAAAFVTVGGCPRATPGCAAATSPRRVPAAR